MTACAYSLKIVPDLFPETYIFLVFSYGSIGCIYYVSDGTPADGFVVYESCPPVSLLCLT